MNSPLHRILLAGLVVAGAALPAAQASAAQPEPPDVPGQIQVGAGYKPFLAGHAVGLQIYSCNGSSWGLVAPRANLYDDKGKVIVTHFAGPRWQARDGSRILGARVDSAPATGTIPWLLLSATPVGESGPDADRLTGTKFIQRVNTTGGVAPAAGTCTAKRTGDVEEIDYTADYSFWKAA